jgi:hypothetical protein
MVKVKFFTSGERAHRAHCDALCSPKPLLMPVEQTYTFKDMISLYVTFGRHLAHLLSTNYG